MQDDTNLFERAFLRLAIKTSFQPENSYLLLMLTFLSLDG